MPWIPHPAWMPDRPVKAREVWPVIGDLSVSQNLKAFSASPSIELIIPFGGQVSCNINNGSPFPPIRAPRLVDFFASLVHLLIKWFIVSSFSPHDLNSLLVAYYQFSLLYYYPSWRCFTLLLEERFPFRSCVKVFMCVNLLVFHLKFPYYCFSSHFCFLVFVIVIIIVQFANTILGCCD